MKTKIIILTLIVLSSLTFAGIDTKSPDVEIINPKDGEVLSCDKVFTVKVKASDDVKIELVEITFGQLICPVKKKPYSCKFFLEQKNSNRFIITATAFDTSGNIDNHIIDIFCEEE